MTTEEIVKTEAIINNWIKSDIKLHTDVLSIEEAKLTGATSSTTEF